MKQAIITFKKNHIPVEIKRHPRSRQIRLSVFSDGRVLLTLPKRASMKQAQKFLDEKEAWIEERLEKPVDTRQASPIERRKKYLKYKEDARKLTIEWLAVVNRHYGFSFKKVSIRDQKTRWGSCSGKGNLSFHYKIFFLPKELQEYLIAHELCHLKEMNHSPAFWNLVARSIPDYRVRRKKLRASG